MDLAAVFFINLLSRMLTKRKLCMYFSDVIEFLFLSLKSLEPSSVSQSGSSRRDIHQQRGSFVQERNPLGVFFSFCLILPCFGQQMKHSLLEPPKSFPEAAQSRMDP